MKPRCRFLVRFCQWSSPEPSITTPFWEFFQGILESLKPVANIPTSAEWCLIWSKIINKHVFISHAVLQVGQPYGHRRDIFHKPAGILKFCRPQQGHGLFRASSVSCNSALNLWLFDSKDKSLNSLEVMSSYFQSVTLGSLQNCHCIVGLSSSQVHPSHTHDQCIVEMLGKQEGECYICYRFSP